MAVLLTLKRSVPIDEHALSVKVSKAEGKKVELPIGQIKAVQKVLLDLLAQEWRQNPRGVIRLLRKHGGQ
jgi:hypothetical protein